MYIEPNHGKGTLEEFKVWNIKLSSTVSDNKNIRIRKLEWIVRLRARKIDKNHVKCFKSN